MKQPLKRSEQSSLKVLRIQGKLAAILLMSKSRNLMMLALLTTRQSRPISKQVFLSLRRTSTMLFRKCLMPTLREILTLKVIHSKFLMTSLQKFMKRKLKLTHGSMQRLLTSSTLPMISMPPSTRLRSLKNGDITHIKSSTTALHQPRCLSMNAERASLRHSRLLRTAW